MSFIRLVLYEIRFFTNLRNKMYLFILFFQPIVYLTIVKYMLLMRNGISEGKYVIAVGIMSTWSYVLYSSGSSLISLRWSGTLELIMNASTSLFRILLSKAINNAIIGTLSIAIAYIYSVYLFGFDLTFSQPLGIGLSLLALIVSLISVGMLLSIIYSLFQNVYAYQNLILFPMMILTGIFYPIELLPLFVQYISFMIPMSWMIDSLYFSVQHNEIHILHLTIGFAISALYILFSFLLIKRMSQKIKETSVMGVF
jgi:ABC-2 type transport system permease protein